MKFKFLAIAGLLLFSFNLKAQSLSRVTQGVDLGFGSDFKSPSATWGPSAMYHQELSLKNFSMLRIGWGVRAYGLYTGLANLVPRSAASSGDSLSFGSTNTFGVSFLLGASINFGMVEIGANTDLAGIAFGPRRSGLYSSNTLEGEGASYYNDYVYASPTSVNTMPLLFSNQNGQSEIYARIFLVRQIGLKVGYKFGNTVLISEVKLNNSQRRFAAPYSFPYAALTFPIFN